MAYRFTVKDYHRMAEADIFARYIWSEPLTLVL